MFAITRRHTAAALAGALLTLSASPALAADGDVAATRHAGVVAGYDGAVAGYAATIESFTIEGGDTVQALCVQYGIALNEASDYVVVPRSEGPAGAGRAAWIGANHASVGTPLEDANLEAVAVQAAAWSFTDGVTYDSSNLDNTAARERAAELVAAAGSIAARTSSYDVTVTVERDGNAVVATATVLGDGSPLGEQDVTFNLTGAAEGELTATTDATGKARVTAPGVDGEGAVTVTYTGTLAAGTLLRPVAGGQMFVTTEPAQVTRTARTSFDAAPAPEPEPEPTEDPEPEVVDDPEPADEEDPLPAPEPEPTPEPTPEPDEPEELPFTGPEDALLPLGILAGIGAAAYGRRMRKLAD